MAGSAAARQTEHENPLYLYWSMLLNSMLGRITNSECLNLGTDLWEFAAYIVATEKGDVKGRAELYRPRNSGLFEVTLTGTTEVGGSKQCAWDDSAATELSSLLDGTIQNVSHLGNRLVLMYDPRPKEAPNHHPLHLLLAMTIEFQIRGCRQTYGACWPKLFQSFRTERWQDDDYEARAWITVIRKPHSTDFWIRVDQPPTNPPHLRNTVAILQALEFYFGANRVITLRDQDGQTEAMIQFHKSK